MIFGQTSVFPRKAKSHLFDKLRVPQASLAGHASRTTAAVPRKAPGEEGAVSAARPCGAKWMSDAVCGFMLSLMLSFQRDPDCLSAALPKRDPPSPPSSLSSAPPGAPEFAGPPNCTRASCRLLLPVGGALHPACHLQKPSQHPCEVDAAVTSCL